MNQQTLRCPKCQNAMFQGSHFCMRCGTSLDKAVESVRRPPPRPSGKLAKPETLNPLELDLNAKAARAAEEHAALPRAPVAYASPAPAIEAVEEAFEDVLPEERPESRDPPADRQRSQEPMTEYSRDEVQRRIRAKQSLKRAGLSGMQLTGLDLEGIDFARADLDGANLDSAKLRGANLRHANLSNASLKGADLREVDLGKADLEGADLSRALLEGATLTRASLEGARLDGANLQGADLADADLSGAHAELASFADAVLERATFQDAVLRGCDMRRADARHAIFRGADLESAQLGQAKVAGATFSEARLGSATFDWIDASVAGDDSRRLESDRARAFLAGDVGVESTMRYFGRGDVLRDASLEFGEDSRIQIDSRFENCSITLREGAELTIGDPGVLRGCQIVGSGRIIVHGRFFERSSPGIVGVRSLVVSARGGITSGVEQAEESTVFAFEPGSQLRLKILRPKPAAAAE